MWRKYGLVYGISVTVAIFCSGCSTTSRQMSYADINYFRIDCSKRDEQIKMLQSMQSTRDDRGAAKVRNILQPWLRYTDPDQYADNYYQGTGRTDAYINYTIHDITTSCPGDYF